MNEIQKIGDVLIPSFTGLRLVLSSKQETIGMGVLIPSFTGLRLVGTITAKQPSGRSLNPFFYRSSVGLIDAHEAFSELKS